MKHQAMKRKPITRIVLAASLLIAAAPALAASEADFKAAFTAAEAAEQQAGTLRDRWTTTEAALKAAKQAADKGDFEAAVASAKKAEALAKASIFQATNEKDRWKHAVIH